MRAVGGVSAGVVFAVAAACAAQDLRELHYRIESAGSELRWELPATLHTVHGSAPEVEGRVDAESSGGEWAVRSRIAVRAATMVTGNASRDRTMREKVLETDAFPEIVFEARRVIADLTRFQAGRHFTADVSGDLMVHGKRLPLRLPVEVEVLADRAVLSGSFPLLWKAYGLPDPSFGLVKVREPMKVLFRLNAVRIAVEP
jgi:polyisoprenoid-binding protein YceI